MGKKLGFTSLFYNNSSRPWTYCKQARTKSFREGGDHECNNIDTVPKVRDVECLESTESLFTNTSEGSESFSTVTDGSEMEMVLQGMRSERLFFEPGGTSSIMEDARVIADTIPFKGSFAVTMESRDPYYDFRASMEEMVVVYGVEELEELLGFYLRVNGKETHGFILGAFIDLLLLLSSASFSYPSSCSSISSFEIVEILEEEEEGSNGSC
ncbi:hypothetical protein J5N97_022555 [Dioscorea zingiberensis]|uniref:Transcription repressor n=1 Tax=Dioscorea zingiberensis TaxID=325984 RepID=A0A9D5HB40_9LILI|nr:hypothetical protein J5N97_022555 [Dioscorea zingiberensis]